MSKLITVFYLSCIISIVSCAAGKHVNTPKITYTTHVKQIIDANCASTCHNATKRSGGINLTTYEFVKDQCINGKLIAAVQHADGAKAMPKRAPKLDDASIQVLVDWTATGFTK